MALSDKQKKIIMAGIGISKRRGAGKDFIEIVENKITGATLTAFVSALKTELIAMKTARKTAIQSEITNLNA